MRGTRYGGSGRRRWVPLAAAAVVGGAILTPVAAGANTTPAPASAHRLAAADPMRASLAEEAGIRASEIISAAKPPAGDLIAGVRWYGASGTLRVAYSEGVTRTAAAGEARTAFEQSAVAAVRKAGNATRVEFVRVPRSMQQLTDVANRMVRTRESWAGKEPSRKVVAAVPDPFGSRVMLQLTSRDAALEARARAAFDVPIDVEVAARPVRAGRYFDTGGWTTGNALFFGPTQDPLYGDAQCTQGFAWRSGNAVYASTAGHCRAVGGSVWNGNPNQRIGYVSNRWYTDGGPTDVEFIRITVGSADATIWLGAHGQEVLRTVRSADNDAAAVGVRVCSHGANGAVRCGTITARNVPAVFEDGHVTNGLTCVGMDAGVLPPIGGDSGGPIVTSNPDGTVKAWGQLVAIVSPEDAPHTNCDFWFTPVRTISAFTNSTLLVG